MEKEMIVKSLQSTIAEMQGKLDQLNLAEKNSVSPVSQQIELGLFHFNVLMLSFSLTGK